MKISWLSPPLLSSSQDVIPNCLVRFIKEDLSVTPLGFFFTSNVVSDASPEAASSGYEDPLKDLPIYTTWLHDDDCTRRVKERLCSGIYLIYSVL